MSEVKTQIKENMRYAKQIFEERLADANDYRNKEIELGFIQEKHGKKYPSPSENEITMMRQHPFACWLRSDANFREAKSLVSKRKLNVFQRTDNEIIKKYIEKMVLVRICAIQIYFFERKLSGQVVTLEGVKSDIEMMENLNLSLNRGSLRFQNGAKQLVFHQLLKELLSNPEHNVFSSQKNHDELLRQAFGKFLMAELFRTYEGVSKEATVDITLAISEIFFPVSMDKRDAQRQAGEIFETVCKENKFLNLTCIEVLLGFSQNL